MRFLRDTRVVESGMEPTQIGVAWRFGGFEEKSARRCQLCYWAAHTAGSRANRQLGLGIIDSRLGGPRIVYKQHETTKRRVPAKAVFRLPDLGEAKWAVLDTVTAAFGSTGFAMWTPLCKGNEVILEGRSINVSEECLLSEVQRRNPGLGRRLRRDFSRVSGGTTHFVGCEMESPATTRTDMWTIWRGSAPRIRS
jgi:hypothetical protein